MPVICEDILTRPSPSYTAKMLHPVPSASSVDRMRYVLDHCKGKKVLSLGCTGQLQEYLDECTDECYGIDIVELERKRFIRCDLDDQEDRVRAFGVLPVSFDMILAAEILEHLGNPGALLSDLHCRWRCPLLVTVPNAFSRAGMPWLLRNIECVNRQHVAWYSWYTLQTLLERFGYGVVEFHWYNGPPLFAEGIIMLAE